MSSEKQRVAVLLFVLGLAVVVPSILLLPAERAATIAGLSITFLLGSTWLWWSAAYVWWRRRHAGMLLLDLGRRWPDPVSSGAGALLSIGLALWALLTPYLHPRVLALGYLSVAVYALLQSLLPLFRPIQLRIRGISLPAQYIPWEHIGAYTLHDLPAYTEIAIRYRAWAITPDYPLVLTLWCRPEERDAVDIVMASHVSAGSRRRRPFPPGPV